MKRTIKFWTKEEDKMIAVTFKKTNSQSETAQILQKELNRSKAAIQVRVSKMFRTSSPTRTRIRKEDKKSVNLPSGFTFDIKPNRVVMFNDHVRLYF